MRPGGGRGQVDDVALAQAVGGHDLQTDFLRALVLVHHAASYLDGDRARSHSRGAASRRDYARHHLDGDAAGAQIVEFVAAAPRAEEHTADITALMRIWDAVV